MHQRRFPRHGCDAAHIRRINGECGYEGNEGGKSSPSWSARETAVFGILTYARSTRDAELGPKCVHLVHSQRYPARRRRELVSVSPAFVALHIGRKGISLRAETKGFCRLRVCRNACDWRYLFAIIRTARYWRGEYRNRQVYSQFGAPTNRITSGI